MKKKKISLLDIIVYLILIALSITIIYPMLNVVAISFSDNFNVMARTVTIFPKGFNLDAFNYIAEDGKVFRAFGYTVYYTAFGVLINVLMTSLMAYPLSKKDLIGRKFYIKMVMFTMFFSGGMIPSFLLVKELHMLDTVWSLVIPGAIVTMYLLVMITFFQSIPDSLYEAAYLDGASEMQVFIKIAMPLSKASLASIALFNFRSYWNTYYTPMLYLNDKKKFPLQLILRSMLLEGEQTTGTSPIKEELLITPTSVKYATIVLTMLPVMIVYPFAQKYFVKGVMIGSVKG